jgi:hypothetical protein
MALLHASLRNFKALAITLGMPLFMLISFWILSLSGDDARLAQCGCRLAAHLNGD